MSIPTHRSSCVTKAFQVKCKDCDSSVYYFSCNCGSKLLFEELGYPGLFTFVEIE